MPHKQDSKPKPDDTKANDPDDMTAKSIGQKSSEKNQEKLQQSLSSSSPTPKTYKNAQAKNYDIRIKESNINKRKSNKTKNK